jgi:hypothetical protein
VLDEHLRKEIDMSKPELIKRSGWLFIAGAVVFMTILIPYDPISIPGSLISSILLTIGMSGLRAGYSETVSPFGRKMLRVGELGPAGWVIGIIFMALMGVEAVGKGLWVLLFVAPAGSLCGLTLFGLTALISKPMPRLNWLPLLAGIWYPVTFVIFSIYDISQKGVFPEQYVPQLVVMMVIQFLALCILGFVLIGDSSKEMATA